MGVGKAFASASMGVNTKPMDIKTPSTKQIKQLMAEAIFRRTGDLRIIVEPETLKFLNQRKKTRKAFQDWRERENGA